MKHPDPLMPTRSASPHPESVLVALLKDRADHAILHRQLWYRIPVESAPKIVTERRVKIMGFYLPAVFGEEHRWKIHHFGRVRKIAEATRNNELTTQGWSVLRYTTGALTNRMDAVMEEIADNINRCKGLKDDDASYLNIPRPPRDGQMNLFE